MTTIQFGTSGWRSIMAEDFTFANVRRVIQAIGTYLKEHEDISRPVVVGYDTRFLSPEFAREAAALLSSQGLKVLFSKEFIPTPAVAFSILDQKAIGAVNFTASHNPAEYNGIKFNTAHGGPASPDVTHAIERLANELPDDLKAPSDSPTYASFDAKPAYLKRLQRMIDVSVLKKARLRIGVDVLYGTGCGYLDTFFEKTGCQIVVLHNWRDVQFGGQAPEPAESQLRELKRMMRSKKLAAGFGTDGDADRFGIMDTDGTLLSPNEILPIVLAHLVKTRGWKGRVVRSVMTSHFIDAVARRYNLPLLETPVGFKYIAQAMEEGNFLMGGEESGGLTIQGHVPEKDGLLACLLMAEVRALERKSYRDILRALRRDVGPYYSRRINLHLSPEVMQGLRTRLHSFTPSSLEGLEVKKIVRLDGFKFIFMDDSWLGIRLSGTEPVVRLYLEADSTKKLKTLEHIGNQLIAQAN